MRVCIKEKMVKICIEKWCITFDANFDWEVLENELSNAGMIVTSKKDITSWLSFLQVIRFFSISSKLLASSHEQKIIFFELRNNNIFEAFCTNGYLCCISIYLKKDLERKWRRQLWNTFTMHYNLELSKNKLVWA